MRFQDKTALVTGAGSGIGRACARMFAAGGARTVCADVNFAAAEATTAAIREAGGEAVAVRADVSRATDAEAMVAAARKAYGTLNILHANAGITPRATPIHELSEEEWDAVMSINLKGVWLTSKYAIPALIASGDGVIVNTASLAGIRSRPYRAHYEASKAGVISLTRTLAIELSPHGIRANCICPGPTETPGRTASLGDATGAAQRRSTIAALPIPRIARPEEIAAAVGFLASAESSYINGFALLLDGGERAGLTNGLRPIADSGVDG